MKNLNSLLYFLFVLAILSSCQKEQTPSNDIAEISKSSTEVTTEKCAKISIDDALKNLVLENTKVSAILFGEIDEKGKSKFNAYGSITPSDYIFTASPGSKGVTAYMIMKEKINIDQTIDRWFPQSEGYTQSKQITLRMLLSHTSGINDYPGRIPNVESTPQQIIDQIYKNSTLKYEPGAFWCYSNTNFVLAGMILEKVTKKTYAENLRKYFGRIAPSLFIMDGRTFTPAAAYLPCPFNPTIPSFAGGLVGTSEDVLKAFRHIYRSREYEKMKQFVSVPSYGSICSDCNCDFYIYADVYGLGTAKYTINGRTVYGADGSIGIGYPQIFTYKDKTYLINTVMAAYLTVKTDPLTMKKHHAETLLGIAIHD